MSKMPKVVIVGRTNVGKSSLFNRIAPNVQSLVFDQEGVTRDYLSDTIEWNGVRFNLFDTGGIDLCKSTDAITCLVTAKVQKMLEEATLLLFVVDRKTGITDQDLKICKILRSIRKPVFVLVNKVDTHLQEDEVFEFARLGFEELLPVSAVHGLGVADMLDKVTSFITKSKQDLPSVEEEAEFKVAFLGRPNAGKSSLINLLVQQDFSIVSDIAGTTREALRKKIAFNKKVIELIDTAGVRKKGSIDDKLESMMATNALQISKRAHIVLLLIDVKEPHLTAQELKLTSYAFDNGSAVIVLFNKTDLLDEEKKTSLEYSLEKYEYFLKKLETVHISCKTGKNVNKILPLVQKVWDRFSMRISESRLTDIFMEALQKAPLYKIGKRLDFYGARQVGGAPMRIELTVRNKELFEDHHLAFFENVLRKKENLKSVPIFFYLKAKR